KPELTLPDRARGKTGHFDAMRRFLSGVSFGGVTLPGRWHDSSQIALSVGTPRARVRSLGRTRAKAVMKKAKFLQDAKIEPARFYRNPLDIMRDRRLTDEDRLQIVAAWEQDTLTAPE